MTGVTGKASVHGLGTKASDRELWQSGGDLDWMTRQGGCLEKTDRDCTTQKMVDSV